MRVQPKYTKQPIKYNSNDFRNRFALGTCCDDIMYHLGYESETTLPMILVYDVNKLEPLFNNKNFHLCTAFGTTFDLNIDWGDGTTSHLSPTTQDPDMGISPGMGVAFHNYSETGTYVVKVKGHTEGIFFRSAENTSPAIQCSVGYKYDYSGYNGGIKQEEVFVDGYEDICNYELREIKQWGDLKITMGTTQAPLFVTSVNLEYLVAVLNHYVKIPDSPLTGFSENKNFANAFMHLPIKSIPNHFMQNCKKATSVYMMLNGCVQHIGDYAFADLPDITSGIVIGNDTNFKFEPFEINPLMKYSLHTIGSYVFKNCINLGSDDTWIWCYHNKPIVSIGDGMFENCTSLRVIEMMFANTLILQSVGKDMFKNCTSLENAWYLFSNHIANFYNENFDSYTLLNNEYKKMFNITIGLKSIGSGMFENCNKLNNISDMFYRCYWLENIPEDLFYDCPIENSSRLFNTVISKGEYKKGVYYENKSYQSLVSDMTVLNLPNRMFNYNLIKPNSSFNNAFERSVQTYVDPVDPSGFGGLNEYIGMTTGTAYPLWDYVINVNGSCESCYRWQTDLDNYTDIPDNWKGIISEQEVGE